MIDPSVSLGKNVQIIHPELVNLYECTIGDNTKIAAFVEIGKGVIIGSNVKIQAFAFIPEGVTIENNCFIGPHVCFTNDKYPQAENRGWRVEKTIVKKGASIGANATILCGITIGEKAIIGAGAVVTRNVPANTTVIGNPARPVTAERKL